MKTAILAHAGDQLHIHPDTAAALVAVLAALIVIAAWRWRRGRAGR